MPQVLIATAAAYAFAAISASPFLIGALGTFGATLIGALASSLIAFAGEALLAPGAKSGVQTIRQPISTHKLIRGLSRVGGALTFAENPALNGFWVQVLGFDDTQINNKDLYLIITMAAQPSTRLGPVFFDDVEVPLSDDDNFAVNPQDLPDGSTPKSYKDRAAVYFGHGTVQGDATLHGWISSHVGGWTPDCKQDGRTKLGVYLHWTSSTYATGIPNISATIYGKPMYDPRKSGFDIVSSDTSDPSVFTTSTDHPFSPGQLIWIKGHDATDLDGDPIVGEYEVGTVPSSTTFTLLKYSQDLSLMTGGTGGTATAMFWTDNSEIGLYDMLCDRTYGIAADYDLEVPEDLFIDGANLCDEIVERALLSTTFTADPGTDKITYAVEQTAGDVQSLQQVQVSSTGTLPSGLSATAIYYFVQAEAGPIGYLCSSLDNAKQNPPDPVNFTTAGTGTLTLTLVTTFTANLATGTSVANSLVLYSQSQRLLTGTVVNVSSTGTLPSPLVADTDYYAIFETERRVRLATTLSRARGNDAIVLTDDGSGSHIIVATGEPRYACDGLVDTANTPQDIIQNILSSMAGLLVPSGGMFKSYPGSYRMPTITLDESDLRGPIDCQTLQSGSQSCNSVKGTFIDPFNHWQPADYPARRDVTFIAEDNNRTVWRDFTLGMTLSATGAQRLSKIELRRARRDLAPRLPCKFTAFQVDAAESFYVDNAMWGWAGEVFETTAWNFTIFEDENGIPALGVDLTGRENDANIYAWTAAEEASTSPQPKTGLPTPFQVASPTGLLVTSGNAALYVRADGTVMARAHLTWVAPLDAFVTSGGNIEMAYKRSSDTAWIPGGPPLPGSSTESYVNDVQVGIPYDFALRSTNAVGAVSDTDHPWQCEALGVLMQGKTDAPSDVETLTVVQSGAVVILSGSPIPDDDVTAFEYRYGASRDWDRMTFIEAPHARPSGELVAASCTTASIPSGLWWFAVKAKDTSGNYSVNAAYIQKNIENDQLTVLDSSPEAPSWANLDQNSGTGFLRHWTGVLVPDSTVLADAMSDADLWDTFNAFPVAQAIYEIVPLDLGADLAVTVFVPDFSALAGPGETGSIDCGAFADYWLSADSDPDTWFPLTSPLNITARYIRVRIVMNIATSVTPVPVPAIVYTFTPNVATAPAGDQDGTDTAGAGGTTITFGTPFAAPPRVVATAVGANVAWTTSVTASDFVLHVGPNTVTDTGGTASWNARGV